MLIKRYLIPANFLRPKINENRLTKISFNARMEEALNIFTTEHQLGTALDLVNKNREKV